jgi:adenylate cyclase
MLHTLMKRIFYVSRCAPSLGAEDLRKIQQASERNNSRDEITGFLIRLSDFFFQALEGPEESVDRLFRSKIQQDSRHTEILTLRTEANVTSRQFPEWRMKVFDLSSDQRELPTAFRYLMEALTESHLTLARYTQPSVVNLLQQGIDPSRLSPRKQTVAVLFSDIIGFSILAERLSPDDLLRLVNAHVRVCAEAVEGNGGMINKLLGDGVLAYFSGESSDGAIRAALELIRRMISFRAEAPEGSPESHLYSGVGLAFGEVYEGNIGGESKQDFTILGNTVNLASRLESMTRQLGVRLVASRAVVDHAKDTWPFVSLGSHPLKGLGDAGPLFGIADLPPLDLEEAYASIRTAAFRTPR